MMSDEHKEKTKMGRKEYLLKKTGLVWRVDDNIEVYCDKYQYIIMIRGDSTYLYFETLEQVMMELYENKLKELMVAGKKDVQSLMGAIEGAKNWINERSRSLLEGQNQNNSSPR